MHIFRKDNGLVWFRFDKNKYGTNFCLSKLKRIKWNSKIKNQTRTAGFWFGSDLYWNPKIIYKISKQIFEKRNSNSFIQKLICLRIVLFEKYIQNTEINIWKRNSNSFIRKLIYLQIVTNMIKYVWINLKITKKEKRNQYIWKRSRVFNSNNNAENEENTQFFLNHI